MAQQQANLPKFLQTASGEIGILQARWEDFLTTLGQDAVPIIKAVLETMINLLTEADHWLEENKDGIAIIANEIAGIISSFNKAQEGLSKIGESLSTAREEGAGWVKWLDFAARIWVQIVDTVGKVVNPLFAIGRGIQDAIERSTQFKKVLEDIIYRVDKIVPQLGLKAKWDEIFNPTIPETPTAFIPESNTQNLKTQKELQDKLTDIMKDGQDKRADLERDYQQKLADIDRDYSQKLADIANDTAQKKEDALADYNSKIEGINKDANDAYIS